MQDDFYSNLENAPDRFFKDVEQVQKELEKKMLALVSRLSVTNGSISNQDFQVIEAISEELSQYIFQTNYVDGLTSYAGVFNKQSELIKDHFGNDFSDKAVYNDMVVDAQRRILEPLTDNITPVIKNPVRDVLAEAIGSNAGYNDTVDRLREVLVGTGDRHGELLRYAKQIARDGLTVASRSLTKKIGDDLGFQWYYYSGGTVTDSRDFCRHRAGRYFSKSEVESWASLSWQGKAPVNEQTIFVWAGGYNCLHSILPVSADIVPSSVKNRA